MYFTISMKWSHLLLLQLIEIYRIDFECLIFVFIPKMNMYSEHILAVETRFFQVTLSVPTVNKLSTRTFYLFFLT